jgi:hypothetical protein
MVQLQLKEYLKADDFPKNGILKVTFLDEGFFGTAVFDGQESETFEIGIKLADGDHRRWTMNKTSQRAVAESLGGSDTAKWVGQGAELFLADTSIAGKIKKVIYARGKQ